MAEYVDLYKKPTDLRKARLGVTYRELWYALERAADEAMVMGNKKLQNRLKKEAAKYYQLSKKMLSGVTPTSISVATVEQTLYELKNFADEERTCAFPGWLSSKLIKMIEKITEKANTFLKRTVRAEPEIELALETLAAAMRKRKEESKRDLY